MKLLVVKFYFILFFLGPRDLQWSPRTTLSISNPDNCDNGYNLYVYNSILMSIFLFIF